MKRTALMTCLILGSALIGYTAAHWGTPPSAARPLVNRENLAPPADSSQPQANTSTGVERRSRQEIDAAVKQLISEHQVGQPLIGSPADAYHFMVAHRSERGEAELHSGMDDLFIARDGSAEVVLGGELVSGKEVSPGEWRAPSIKGGRSVTLNVGDVLRIPRNTPHQTIPRGQFTYLVVKVRTGS